VTGSVLLTFYILVRGHATVAFQTDFLIRSCGGIVWSFVLFLLAIVLSVILRFTASDYPFSDFKVFLPYK